MNVKKNTLENLPDRARLIVNTNDMIFPLSYDSFGKVAIIPTKLDGQLVSTGFFGLKFKSHGDACLLWGIVRSDYVQKQFIHVASGYTQREISKTDLKKHILIPIPIKKKEELGKEISKKLQKAKEAREKELSLFKEINNLSKETIGGYI